MFIEAKQTIKRRPKSAERSVLHMPKKEFMINFFYKQKANHCRNIKYLHCSAKRKSQILFDQLQGSQKVAFQQISIRGKSVIMEQTSRSSHTSLKHFSSQNKPYHPKNRTYSFSQQLHKQKPVALSTLFTKDSNRSLMNNKKNMMETNDLNACISKQIEDRFSKTKTLFKQQQKMKKVQRIQKIYPNKFKALNKKVVKQVTSIAEAYTPWQKNAGQMCQEFNNQLHQIK